MKKADNIDKYALQLSIRNRQTRIAENKKLVEKYRFEIGKILLTIQHEEEQLKLEQSKLTNKKGASLL